jgi:lipopolysaccharide heptosyltransferase I
MTFMTLKNLEVNPSVLLVKPSALGDIVHTFPIVRAIKQSIPNVLIDWVVADSYADLARMSPHINEVFPFRRKAWGKWWKTSTVMEVFGYIKSLRQREYGAILDLQGLLRSGLITFVARADLKIGFANGREGAPIFYNSKIPAPDHGAHAIDRYFSTLIGLGIDQPGPVGYDLEIPVKESLWADLNTPNEPFAIINPNSRWETKRWSPEQFGNLAAKLYKEEGLKCVIIGGPFDIERGKQVADIAGEGVVNLTGKGGIVHLAAALKKATVMFSNDSGPLHLAVALGTPTVSIFGPTDPAMTGPYGPGHAVIRQNLDCAPCFKRQCPYNHECMKQTCVDEIIEAWRGLKREAI